MKQKVKIALLLLFSSCALPAQDKSTQPPPTLDDLIQSVQDWAQDNLDDRVLAALNDIDQDRVRKFFLEIQKRFADTNLYDLSSLRDVAVRLLPVLMQFEETRPYGDWLQTHLDYLDASSEIQQEMKQANPPKPGGPPRPLPPPTIQIERKVWDRKLSKTVQPKLASSYLPLLKQVFAEEKIPAELVWVAEVESSFNPEARSPVGAAGLFQLMPATAKSLNLSTWPSDERLQPEKNARAAAKYLHQLHNHYQDWALTLAAYNAGEGRVDNLLKQTKVKTFEGIHNRLPSETQMYVPKIEATIRKREGKALTELVMAR